MVQAATSGNGVSVARAETFTIMPVPSVRIAGMAG